MNEYQELSTLDFKPSLKIIDYFSNKNINIEKFISFLADFWAPQSIKNFKKKYDK